LTKEERSRPSTKREKNIPGMKDELDGSNKEDLRSNNTTLVPSLKELEKRNRIDPYSKGKRDTEIGRDNRHEKKNTPGPAEKVKGTNYSGEGLHMV